MDDNIFGQLDSDYQIVYADPPWSYRDKGNAGERGASHKYETQDMDWIRSLPVSDIVHEDCALFMWVGLPRAVNVIKWPFRTAHAYEEHWKAAGFEMV